MRLIPRDEEFFRMFAEIAGILRESAGHLCQLFAEPERLDTHVGTIKELEHRADTLTHDVMVRIDSTFVTPLDREDIHLLASRLDDVIDLLDGTARRAQMFHITEVREPARQLASVLERAAGTIEAAVGKLRKPKEMTTHTRELKLLEEEGDAIYHEAVGLLFVGQPDPIEVIKWKELYDKLEDAIDQCDDVANVLESIALKNG